MKAILIAIGAVVITTIICFLTFRRLKTFQKHGTKKVDYTKLVTTLVFIDLAVGIFVYLLAFMIINRKRGEYGNPYNPDRIMDYSDEIRIPNQNILDSAIKRAEQRRDDVRFTPQHQRMF